MSSERIDNRRLGEWDLADVIDDLYVDAMPDHVLEDPAMESLLDNTEWDVRALLEGKGVNLYFDKHGQVRRQEPKT